MISRTRSVKALYHRAAFVLNELRAANMERRMEFSLFSAFALESKHYFVKSTCTKSRQWLFKIFRLEIVFLVVARQKHEDRSRLRERAFLLHLYE